MSETQEPSSYQRAISAWFPHFKSETLDPSSPHCVLSQATVQAQRREAARSVPPASRPAADGPPKRSRREGVKPFQFRSLAGGSGASCAELVWRELVDGGPGASLTIRRVMDIGDMNRSDAFKALRRAVAAGAVVIEGDGDSAVIRLGPFVPVNGHARRVQGV